MHYARACTVTLCNNHMVRVRRVPIVQCKYIIPHVDTGSTENNEPEKSFTNFLNIPFHSSLVPHKHKPPGKVSRKFTEYTPHRKRFPLQPAIHYASGVRFQWYLPESLRFRFKFVSWGAHYTSPQSLGS